jgi:methionyl-tRNA formyltransferase
MLIKKNKIVVFASGVLGLEMLEYLKNISEIKFIATDSKSEGVILFSKMNKINIFIGKPDNNDLYLKLQQVNEKILLSINYIFILEKKIFRLFEFPINFHGSLLPKYRGRTPHIWAIINNEKQTGITAHFIEEQCDVGDIIFQKSIIINEDMTGSDLLLIYKKEYPIVILKVLEMINNNNVIRFPQKNVESTFFHKRTPDDGLINWDWQKERLYNWVRALSDPYPGAFTFYYKKKIIIDEIKFSNVGFDSLIENGTIIALKPNNNPIIKVQNGTIELTKIRATPTIFKINTKFYYEN